MRFFTERSGFMKKIFFIALISFCFLVELGQAETIVFEGTPLIKNSASAEGTNNEQVQGEDQTNYKLIITKEGNEFIWFSREKKKLKHVKSGAFDYFVNLDGSGYIKITKAENGKYLYLEHMSIGLQTITYWGISEKFEP
jgi:hypothetical protein